MAIGRRRQDTPQDIAAFLELEPVFGRDLPRGRPFVEALESAYAALVRMERGEADLLAA
jgi:hypothetical protein